MAENQDKCGETNKKKIVTQHTKNKTPTTQKTVTNPAIVDIRIGVLHACHYHLHQVPKVSITSNKAST